MAKITVFLIIFTLSRAAAAGCIEESCWLSAGHAGANQFDNLSPPERMEKYASAHCSSSGECTLDILKTEPNLVAICEGLKPGLAWNRRKQDIFLFSCDCECTAHDNFGWLVDARRGLKELTIQRVILGKWSSKSELNLKPSTIKDTFASHSMCESLDKQKLQDSIFISLIKRPTGNETGPYCYFPTYIHDLNKGFKIETNSKDPNITLDMPLDDDSPEFSTIKNALTAMNRTAS